MALAMNWTPITYVEPSTDGGQILLMRDGIVVGGGVVFLEILGIRF